MAHCYGESTQYLQPTHGLPTGRCYGYGDMEYLVLAVSSSGVGSHRVTVYLPVDVRYTVQM